MNVIVTYGKLVDPAKLSGIPDSELTGIVEATQDGGTLRQIVHGIEINRYTTDQPLRSYIIPRTLTVLQEAQYQLVVQSTAQSLAKLLEDTVASFFILFQE